MSLRGKKRKILIAALVLASVVLFGQAAFAQAPPSATQGQLTKPIGFDFAAGINFSDKFSANVENVTPDLLANYIAELTRFFLRLAVVLAVLMITIGGFQWLIALGNASKISNAKDTILEAFIGLMLALTSYLIFSQIDKSFVELKSLDILDRSSSLALKCNGFFTRDTCNNIALHPDLTCSWACDPHDVQVNFCSNKRETECDVTSDCGTGGGTCVIKKCCSSGSAVFTSACIEAVNHPNIIRGKVFACRPVIYQLGLAATNAQSLDSRIWLTDITNDGCGAVFQVVDRSGLPRDPSDNASCELIKELSIRVNAGTALTNGIINGYPTKCGGSGSGNNFTIQFDSSHCNPQINN